MSDTQFNLFSAGHGGAWRVAPPPAEPPARRDGPATSRAAARSMRAAAPTIRGQVLAWFRGRGAAGGTAEELADALHLRAQTATPRVRELVQAGLLRDSGQRRPTTSGRTAIVWTVTPAGERAT